MTTMQDTAPVVRVADDDDAPTVVEQRILADVRAGRIQMTALGWQYNGAPASAGDTVVLDQLNNWGWVSTSHPNPGTTFPVVIPNDPQVPSARERLLSLAERAQDQEPRDFTLELTSLIWWMQPERLFPLFEELVDYYGILVQRQTGDLTAPVEEEYGGFPGGVDPREMAVEEARRDVDDLLGKLVGPAPWSVVADRGEPVGSIW